MSSDDLGVIFANSLGYCVSDMHPLNSELMQLILYIGYANINRHLILRWEYSNPIKVNTRSPAGVIDGLSKCV